MPAFPGFFKTPPQSLYFDSIVNFAVVLTGFVENAKLDFFHGLRGHLEIKRLKNKAAKTLLFE